jgi:hypothetical protein
MVRVLGTGFVGARCLIQLLAAGMKRPPRSGTWRESDLRAMLCQGAQAKSASALPCSAPI